MSDSEIPYESVFRAAEAVVVTGDPDPATIESMASRARAMKVMPEVPENTDLMSVPGYQALATVLRGAYDQAARGKGKERHANENPFGEQRIMSIARETGIGGHTYQISKKSMEAGDMVNRGDYQKAIHEFRGVIVYAAAAILLAAELEQKQAQEG